MLALHTQHQVINGILPLTRLPMVKFLLALLPHKEPGKKKKRKKNLAQRLPSPRTKVKEIREHHHQFVVKRPKWHPMDQAHKTESDENERERECFV